MWVMQRMRDSKFRGCTDPDSSGLLLRNLNKVTIMGRYSK